MRRAAVIASVAVIGLAGCQNTSESYASADTAVASAEAATDQSGRTASVEMISPTGPPVAEEGAPEPPAGAGAAADAVPQLAYSYRYTLGLPNRAVRGLAAQHEQACIQAGPTRCQVIGSSTMQYGEDQQEVVLEIRAAPAWLTPFRNGLEAQADNADGEILESSTQSEDLTRAIIDTEAHLRAKTTLRDRLQTMLATRDGNLQSVLEVERELARVQGEIDSATATLQAMRGRVSMSQMTLTYRAKGVLAPDNATAPVQAALNNALATFMTGLAGIITVLAFALPFLLVLVPIAWIVRWALKRGRARRSPPAGSEPPASSSDPLHPE